MGYMADAFIDHKPSGSFGEAGLLTYLAPDPANPDVFINVRLTNGAGYYTAGGTTVSGGAALSADQGSPGLLSSAWPVKITDGSAVIGVSSTPMWVTGTVSLNQNRFTAISGSVYGLLVGGQAASLANPLPVTTLDPLLQSAYDIGTAAIYSGQAARGVAQSAASWVIKKTALDASGNPVTIQWAGPGVTWSDRIAHIYS